MGKIEIFLVSVIMAGINPLSDKSLTFHYVQNKNFYFVGNIVACGFDVCF